MPGMRAEVEVLSPETCPVAEFSERAEGPLTSVSRAGQDGDAITEEFTASGETALADDRLSQLFEYRSASVYRFRHEPLDCVCEFVEESSHPISEIRAQDGSLVLSLHLTAIQDLRDLVTDLRERYGSVRIRYLLQVESDEEGSADVVPINRNRLTDRQQEVLETAYRMGYFSYPREANATDVADELGIDSSTFTEHLAAAQSKLMDELVAEL
ncbi:bacterio-opsin activator [Halorhabdus sp. CBA1104]|uniref:helix-turn-helix domain-containing protein n=1 Tax=unclassified Halorhabdus TaxID=2621901 RepID=UPI0012B3D9EE|nr:MULTISPECIES: helix-turn-helix domain-containing protein [unclassified Halorhabdus]QGN07155.1 bacterio-opsin activator [Halorhabdus sp. CBA1104]